MLKALYQKICAPSVLFTFVDADNAHDLNVTPAFNEEGLLSGVTLEIFHSEAEPAETETGTTQEPEGNQSQQQESQLQDTQQQQRPAPLPTATDNVELDPVTGQPKAKASEQV